MSEQTQPSPPKIDNKGYSKQQSLWVFLLLDQDFFSYDYYSSHTWMWYYPRNSPSKKTLIYGSNYWELYNSEDNSKNLMGKCELTWFVLSVPSSVVGPLHRFSYLNYDVIILSTIFLVRKLKTLLHLRNIPKRATP